jgi:hypothetical protein
LASKEIGWMLFCGFAKITLVGSCLRRNDAQASEVTPMTKLALATALIAALSVPAWASGDKTQITPRHRHVQLPSEHQLKSKFPRKTSKRETVTDPYWTPCDYQSAWACGGD